MGTGTLVLKCSGLMSALWPPRDGGQQKSRDMQLPRELPPAAQGLQPLKPTRVSCPWTFIRALPWSELVDIQSPEPGEAESLFIEPLLALTEM